MATLAAFWPAAHEKYSWKFLNKTKLFGNPYALKKCYKGNKQQKDKGCV